MPTVMLFANALHCRILSPYERGGVEGMCASPETGVVVVTGIPDAEAIRSRIEYATRRPVTIVSGGGGAEEVAPDNLWRARTPGDWWSTNYTASSRLMAQSRYAVPPPPQGYPPYVGMEHLAPPRHYAPHPQTAYPYHGGWHGNRWSLL